MSERLDVVGIGNAMVDAIIPSNKEEIEKHDPNRIRTEWNDWRVRGPEQINFQIGVGFKNGKQIRR